MSTASTYVDIPPGGRSYKDPVATALDLPTIGNLQGDMRVTLDTGDVYIWLGDVWVLEPKPGMFTGTVSIVDGSNTLLVNSNGSIDVNVINSTPVVGTPISVYNEVTSVAMSASATVLSYTVPPGQTLLLERVLVSSDSISTIELDLGGFANAKGRICYTEYNIDFEYNSYSLVAGTVITLSATNNSLQSVASFNATLQGVLQ